MFSLPTGADLITLYHVQLPCPTSGGQFPVSFESRECKPRDAKRFYLSVLTESWRVCEGQSEHSARELRGNWSDVESSGHPGDKEYWLKHYIKDPEIPLAAVSLGNSFAVEETIAPFRSPGWFGTVDSPDHFPTRCFSPKEDRAEIMSLEVGKEGREERKNFTEDTIFLSTQRSGSMKGMKTGSWCFTVGLLLLSPR